MSLQISMLKREEDNVVICTLKGSLDSDTFDQFKQKASKQLSQDPTTFMLDLAGLDYISSMGISAIVEVRKMAEDLGKKFLMVHVPKHIEEIFNIIQALPNLQVFANMEEADRYFLEIQKRIKN